MPRYRVRIVTDTDRDTPLLMFLAEDDPPDDVPLALAPKLVVEGPEEFTSSGCLVCEGSLEFQQPDRKQPYRLLAICEDCNAWFLFDLERDRIAHLPAFESPGDE